VGRAAGPGDPAQRDEQPGEGEHREHVPQAVDPDQQGEPEGKPGERGERAGAHPGRRVGRAGVRAPIGGAGRAHPRRGEGVRAQAHRAEEQDERRDLAERGPGGVQQREADREGQRGRRRPPGPGEAGDGAGEGEHGERAEHRGDEQQPGDTRDPVADRVDHRRAGHELRDDPLGGGVEAHAAEVQGGVRAAEVPRRDGQRPVPGQPDGVLRVGGRVAPHHELLAVEDPVEDAGGGGDAEHGRGPPRRGAGDRRQAAQGVPAEQHGEPAAEHRHGQRAEPAEQQQRQPGEEPPAQGEHGHGRHRGEHPARRRPSGGSAFGSVRWDDLRVAAPAGRSPKGGAGRTGNR